MRRVGAAVCHGVWLRPPQSCRLRTTSAIRHPHETAKTKTPRSGTRSDIVPVELHQATVPQVVRLLDRGRQFQGKAERRRKTGSQRQAIERRLREAGKPRIDVQQKRPGNRVDVAEPTQTCANSQMARVGSGLKMPRL